MGKGRNQGGRIGPRDGSKAKTRALEVARGQGERVQVHVGARVVSGVPARGQDQLAEDS